MEKLINYINASKNEISKVIFPAKVQVRNAYIAVALVVTIVSLYLALIDGVMSFGIKHIVG